uniref:eRF1 domain-containing protein n=1 Tax=Brassica oleracea var. oleracea TaxID=109376 RepID=A0A0D3C9I1_BRAOL
VVFSTTRSPSSTSREENGRSGGRQNIKSEIWKIKKLIKGLESARGNGTSMVMNTELLPTSRVVSTGTIRFFTSLPLISLRSMDEEDNLGFVLLLLGRRRDTTMSADFKTELSQSELFDPPLQAKILNINTRKYVFGVEDTLKALEMGAIETLIVWENLDINRARVGELDMRTFDELSDGELYEDSD